MGGCDSIPVPSDSIPTPPARPSVPSSSEHPNIVSSTSSQPLMLEPWRSLDWNKRNDMKENLRKLQLSNPEAGHLRILVHGPAGGGKSSFINSIDSIFQERMTSGALVGHSFTKTYKSYRIKDGKYGSYLPFSICDIMGPERGVSEGVQTSDFRKILAEHVKDGYTFNLSTPCSKEEMATYEKTNQNDVQMVNSKKTYNQEGDMEQNKHPRLGDIIHCLVSVIPADSSLLCGDDCAENEKDYMIKMRQIRSHASLMGIPQIVILTKVDLVCQDLMNDITAVYRSKKVLQKIHHCSNHLGVPVNCIFPVKCYHEEIKLNNNMDVLLLSSLTFILNFANDFAAEMPPPFADKRSSSSKCSAVQKSSSMYNSLNFAQASVRVYQEVKK